jgi:hypothetical protein
MAGAAFWEFERLGWERAAEQYEECWTDTSLAPRPAKSARRSAIGTLLCAPRLIPRNSATYVFMKSPAAAC